jgi:hypothetical protein
MNVLVMGRHCCTDCLSVSEVYLLYCPCLLTPLFDSQLLEEFLFLLTVLRRGMTSALLRKI